MIATFRALTTLRHKVAVPPQYRAIASEVRTPFVRDAWQRITAALSQNRPTSHCEPRDDTKDSIAAANIAERWVSAAIEQLSQDLGQDICYEAPRALVRDGESVIKIVHRPEAWANFPRRDRDETADLYLKRSFAYVKGAPIPFAARVVDRLQMLFGNGEFGDEWALEYGEYPRPWLANRYRMTEVTVDGVSQLIDPSMYGSGSQINPDPSELDPKYRLGGKPRPRGYLTTSTGRSVKIEYWDADWWAVVIDGRMAPGFPRRNPYCPKLPYIRARADSDSETPLYSMLWLAPVLDALLTMKLNWSYLGAYPNPVIETAAGTMGFNPGDLSTGDDADEAKLIWKPGKALDLPPGKTLRFLEPPPVGADLNQLVQILRAMLDVAGIPSILRGADGGADSGYQANQMIAAAQLTFKRLALASQRQFEQMCEFMFWCIKYRIKQPVYVLASGSEGDAKQWIGLTDQGKTSNSVAPVDELGPLTFTFRPVLPTDEQAKAMIAMQLVNAPKQLISKRYAREHFLGVEDPESMDDEIAVEHALEQGPLAQMVVEHALKEAGMLPSAPAGPPGSPPGLPPTPGGEPPMMPPGPGQIGPSPMGPGLPGAMQGGLPTLPGVNMPMQPPSPNGVPGAPGGRSAGAFPGLPPRPPVAV